MPPSAESINTAHLSTLHIHQVLLEKKNQIDLHFFSHIHKRWCGAFLLLVKNMASDLILNTKLNACLSGVFHIFFRFVFRFCFVSERRGYWHIFKQLDPNRQPLFLTY